MTKLNKQDLLNTVSRIPGYAAAYLVCADGMKPLCYTDNIPAVLGYTREEYAALIEKDACDTIFAGNLPEVRAHIERCLCEQGDVYCDFHITRAKDDYLRTKCVSRVIGELDGKPVLLSCFTELSFEADPQTAPGPTDADFKRIVDNISAGIAVMRLRDGQLELVAGNPCLSAIVGVSEKSMKGPTTEHFYRRVHPDDLQVAKDAMKAVFSDRHGAVCIYRTKNEKTNKYIWLQAAAKSVLQPDGSQLAYISYTDITAQKEAESALRRSRQLYQLAVNSAHLTVWEYDLATRRATCPDGGFERAGFSSVVEDVPDSLLDYIDEKDRAQYLLMYADLKAGKPSVGCELWYKRTPSGKPRCIRLTYSTVFDNRGKPVKAYGLIQDITLQKLEEEKYQETMRTMLKAASSSLSTVCLDLTLNRREKTFDSSEAQPAGSADDLLTAAAHVVVDKRAAAEFRAKFSRRALLKSFFSGQTEVSFRYLRLMENGERRWVETFASLTQNPHTGDVEAVLCLFDRDEKVKGERLIQRLTNKEYDFVGVIDAVKRLLRVMNIRAGETFMLPGAKFYREKDFFTKRMLAAIAAEDQERYGQSILFDKVIGHLKKEDIYEFSYACINPDGERRRKQLRYCWLDETHEEILVVRLDVTDAYQRDRERVSLLQSALRSTEKANKMRSHCITNLSHELKTPLNGIAGFTKLALQADSESILRGYLQKISSAAARMQAMVNDMLDLSRLESGNAGFSPESFDMREFIENVVAPVRAAAMEKSVWIDVDDSDWHLGSVVTDKESLQRIFSTLLINAVRFSTPGGRVEFIMESFEPVAGGANCRFLVRDRDAGISKEFLPYLFEPFSHELQEESDGAGAGLGLSIVKHLVELLGGAIWVESSKGKGTTFLMLFRLTDQMEEPGTLSAGAGEVGRLSGRRILICEGNPLYMEITQTLLEHQGAAVVCANDGETGLAAFTASGEYELDAILVDVRMSQMGGLTAVREIRSLDRSDAQTVPIIAMTTDILEIDMDRLKSSGVDACLEKPFLPDDLFAALAARMRC